MITGRDLGFSTRRGSVCVATQFVVLVRRQRVRYLTDAAAPGR